MIRIGSTMTVSPVKQQVSLEAFLEQPETKPASEFSNGEVQQKPMPQGEHSRIQSKLGDSVNQVGEPNQVAIAFPELRCTFGGRSIVPDIAVFRWARIPRQANGRVENRFLIHPDWAIEVLSPDQSQTAVLDKLLHCSQHGTELGWLVDSAEETVLVVDGSQRLQLIRGGAEVPVLPELGLSLSASQIFDWLVL